MESKPERKKKKEPANIYRRGPRGLLWLKYSLGDGVARREPVRGALLPDGSLADGLRMDQAKILLATRKGAVVTGAPISPQVGRVTVADALAAVVADFVVNKKRSLADVEQRIRKHLLPAFQGRRLASITTGDIRRYQQRRQEQGAANGTINRETSVLKRSFSLAVMDGKVLSKPHMPMLRESAPRQGFFTPEQLAAVLAHLPEPLRPAISFGAATGWRLASEVLPLRWRQVDFDAGQVVLDAGTTKSGEARVFPMTRDLRALLVAQRLVTDSVQKAQGIIVPYVFHRNGQRIRSFWESWRKAVIAAGVPSRLVHDLRRSAARAFDRCGIPRAVAMKLMGHRTESMYVRYNIAAPSDLRSPPRSSTPRASRAQNRAKWAQSSPWRPPGARLSPRRCTPRAKPVRASDRFHKPRRRDSFAGRHRSAW